MDSTAKFANSLPACQNFDEVVSPQSHRPVPDDWFVAVTDVVASRKAIAAGKYKAVNIAGVAAITAAMNTLGHQSVPFVFGGDGSAMICAPEQEGLVRRVLAQTAAWVGDEAGLTLRAALVPVFELRRVGSDVQVAAVRLSDAIVNYAFVGGGIGQAEALMKAGKFIVERAGSGDYPDLTGLSCRWTSVRRDNAKVVSLIVEDAGGTGVLPQDVYSGIIEFMTRDGRPLHPVPELGPDFTWPPKGLDLEARATRGKASLTMRKLTILAEALFGWVLGKTGWNAGSFDPNRYRRYTALNTDFRKIQDGLRLTVCLPPERISELRAYLEDKRSEGSIRYGMSEQDQAVLTCFVPSVTDDNHMHFLDGAGGGYAEAASAMH